MKTLKLNDDLEIPAIGFGTWKLSAGREAEQSVAAALKAGYKLIDTAKIYGNEKSVGRAINDSELPRDEIFVTTKLWTSDFGYESALVGFNQSLDELQLDYVDLYLIHWPGNDERARHESWRALIEINGLGSAKSIGVSNFSSSQLKSLIDDSGVTPAVNQIEFHPLIYEQQADTLAYCKQQGIVVEAYSPLARAGALEHKAVVPIAKAHKKSPAQVLLRWAIQHVTVPIPKSSNSERIKDNLDVFDFELSATDMEKLDSISTGESVI
jgi:diketogulonate reductase-like aldo/keto reductase